MPMFPLGSVLLPGGVLPLHVFEPRYRQLVVDCLADDSRPPEFGVTLIERGFEVGGGDQRSDVGTIARMVDVQALEDGRYAVAAVGLRRIRVDEWLPDDPYPRAYVSDWPDEPLEHEADRRELEAGIPAMRKRLAAVFELAVTAGSISAAPEISVDDETGLATYQLAAQSPIGPADRYRALAAPSPLERLDVLGECLDDVEAMLRFQIG